ncbi:MAG: lytic transglycosylase domain-containing protein [Armatimonadetes bacterium]|nr:lytic transglycosylase domain-containing protein [Armatimonadota bacterium]
MAPLNPQGYAEAPPGSNVAPLAPEQLHPQPAAPEQPRYDTTALARLERFISERNPRIKADERRLIAIEVFRYSNWQQMRWEFFAALLAAESDFDRFCVSNKGAMGLGQLMPANCAEFGVADAFDISQNLRGSAQHIGEFLARYSALDPTEQFKLALACYNAGPGAVSRYGGVPPYRETVNYIVKIARLYVRLCQETATANR